jgi:hypothetical protein
VARGHAKARLKCCRLMGRVLDRIHRFSDMQDICAILAPIPAGHSLELVVRS